MVRGEYNALKQSSTRLDKGHGVGIPQLAEPAVRLHLLVVDADFGVRSACAEIAASLGYAVESTGDAGPGAEPDEQARLRGRRHSAGEPAPGGHQGLELVSEVKLLYPETSVIAMTASGSVNAAVEAMRCGASDYLTKPFAMDELSTVLDRASASHQTDTATRQLRERLRLSQGLGSMIGRSGRWRSSTAFFPRSPRARTRCWCWARAARARSWWRGPSMPMGRTLKSRFCPWTAARWCRR
jgi:ActR/RegA family two-component response regulator